MAMPCPYRQPCRCDEVIGKILARLETPVQEKERTYRRGMGQPDWAGFLHGYQQALCEALECLGSSWREAREAKAQPPSDQT